MNAHPMDATLLPPEPSRWSSVVFQFKARCFQMRRLLVDALHPVGRYEIDVKLLDAPLIADWPSDLWRGGESPRERQLQLGKVQNLRVAARLLDGLEIPAGATWSFWRHLGRTTRAKGYNQGRELREGCLIPQTGGGLCQLSGAIYNAALEAGLEIVERHAHSNSMVGSLARIGRDATVFWNYVDLRVRHEGAWRLEVSLDKEQLHVRIRSLHKAARPAPVIAGPVKASAPPNACATCGLESCFRSSSLDTAQQCVDREAVLVDAWWPEWDVWLNNGRKAKRDLFLPLNGIRWKKPNYQWNTTLHTSTRSFPMLTLRRAWATRQLRSEGARRQRVLLQWDARLADAYGRALKAHHSHLIIAQTLLPYLWRDGWLGGRTFDVLMSRLPLKELHAQLDQAAARHPGSQTCADFRAEDELLKNESEALAAASHWITPHSAIARLAGDRAVLLPWSLPVGAASPPSAKVRKNIVFPASTLCRKGAFELREALQGLPVTLELQGGVLEGADFWQGIPLHAPGDGSGGQADVVVLPAFVEHNPRRLLKALAAGTPVIASKACALHDLPGVTEIQAGDARELRAALLQHIMAGANESLPQMPPQPALV